jgi:hypothetical protein
MCCLVGLTLVLLTMARFPPAAVASSGSILEPATEPIPVQTNMTVAIIDYRSHWGAFSRNRPIRDTNLSLSPYTPLLGIYRSDDLTVMDWHIKWFLEHGISIFFMDPNFSWLESTLLKSRYIDKLKFAFNLYIVPDYWGYNIAQISNDVDHQLAGIIPYLSNPSYYRIGSRPVILWGYFSHACCEKGAWSQDFVADLLQRVRQLPGDPYLMASDALDITPSWANKFDALYDNDINWKVANFQKTSAGCYVEPYSFLVQAEIRGQNNLAAVANELGKPFVPTVMPGFNNEKLYTMGIDNWCIKLANRTVDLFKSWMKGVQQIADHNLNMIFINSWNEFTEAHSIEPTKQYAFQYLDAVREVFASGTSQTWPPDIAPTRGNGYVQYLPDGSVSSNLPINQVWPTIKQVVTNMTAAQSGPVLFSDKAKALMANATSAYDQMLQALQTSDFGKVKRIASTILSLLACANEAEREYDIAVPALSSAQVSINNAQSKGRTKGLDPAREALAHANQAFKAWNYSEATRLAKEAQALADKATAPTFLDTLVMGLLTTPVGNTLLAALALTVSIAVVTVALPKIRRPAPRSGQ